MAAPAPSNFMGYCSAGVTALLDAASVEVNEAARAALVNQVETIMAEDVPSLPLYQPPQFVAQWPQLESVVDNPTDQGITWNVEDWELSVIAHPNPDPVPPFPPVPTDPVPRMPSPP